MSRAARRTRCCAAASPRFANGGTEIVVDGYQTRDHTLSAPTAATSHSRTAASCSWVVGHRRSARQRRPDRRRRAEEEAARRAIIRGMTSRRVFPRAGRVPRGCRRGPVRRRVVRAGAAAASAPPAFSAFVDEFLDQFASHHPSIAAGNGLHQYDDRLEDFSAQSIADEIAGLKALRVRLGTIPVDALTPDERVDHRIVGGLIDAWLLELDVNRNWQRNLMLYGSAMSDGVHNLMTMESSPAEVRARRIIAKLKGVPALLAAARTQHRLAAESHGRARRADAPRRVGHADRRFAAGLCRAVRCRAQGGPDGERQRPRPARSTRSSPGSRRRSCRRPMARSPSAGTTSKRAIAPRS